MNISDVYHVGRYVPRYLFSVGSEISFQDQNFYEVMVSHYHPGSTEYTPYYDINIKRRSKMKKATGVGFNLKILADDMNLDGFYQNGERFLFYSKDDAQIVADHLNELYRSFCYHVRGGRVVQ